MGPPGGGDEVEIPPPVRVEEFELTRASDGGSADAPLRLGGVVRYSLHVRATSQFKTGGPVDLVLALPVELEFVQVEGRPSMGFSRLGRFLVHADFDVPPSVDVRLTIQARLWCPVAGDALAVHAAILTRDDWPVASASDYRTMGLPR